MTSKQNIITGRNWFLYIFVQVGKHMASKQGILDLDVVDYAMVFNTKVNLNLSKADRLIFGDSEMNHAMVLTGVHIEVYLHKLIWRIFWWRYLSFTFLCRALYETCFFSPRTKKQFQTEEQPTDVMQKLLVQSRNGESKILGEKIEMKKGLSVWRLNGTQIEFQNNSILVCFQ